MEIWLGALLLIDDFCFSLAYLIDAAYFEFAACFDDPVPLFTLFKLSLRLWWSTSACDPVIVCDLPSARGGLGACVPDPWEARASESRPIGSREL